MRWQLFLTVTAALTFAGADTDAGAAPAGETDVLEQPALVSARAVNAVVLAVTRAGARMVAVGERGIVLLSDDGGTSWRQSPTPTSVSLTSVHFPTAATGWAVGHAGVILHTQDGGASWIRQLDGRRAAALMLEAAERAAGGTDDGKRQLQHARRMLEDGPDKPFFDVLFLDAQRGFAIGADGLFFATQDGGKYWQPWHARVPNLKQRHLYSIRAYGQAVYIAGEEGTLYASTDAGQTFTQMRTPYAGSYFGVLPLASASLIVHGLKGHAYRTDDGGSQWHRILPANVQTDLQAGLTAALVLHDGATLLAGQAGELLRIDAGKKEARILPVVLPFPITGMAQAADGGIVLSGARGLHRVSASQVAK